MPNIDDIKGKVIIEYDGSGVAEAKKDLESLADIVGSGLAESTGSANEALSSLDEQMSKSAESTASFTSEVGSLEKPLVRGSDAVVSMTDALGEHQSAIESTSKAYESLQEPISTTTSMIQYAIPPTLDFAHSAESMQANLGSLNGGFAQMGETLSQSVPLLPQFAGGMHAVSEEFDPKAFGLDVFNENMSVFQDALSNPYPFQMVNQYLHETGQTWDDFNSSIGENNAAIMDQIAAMPVVSQKSFNSMSSDVQSVGQVFYEAAGQTEAFNKQWNDLASSIGEVGQAGGMGTVLYGPQAPWNKLDEALGSTEKSLAGINEIGGIGSIPYGPELPMSNILSDISGGVGDAFGGLMSGLNKIAMPLMAVQMIGMAIGQVSSGIYNMAALAEGPAAHSVGTFTGAIDVMGQHMQAAGEQFSEGLGQGIKPMIDAINNVTGQSGDNGFLGSVGNFIGGTVDVLGNVAQIVAGGLVDLGQFGFTLNASNPVGNSWLQQGWEGLQNTWANWTGQPEPFPTTGGTTSTSVQIDLPAIQQSLTQTIAVMNAQANNPQYLAAQAYLQSQGGYAQLGQAGYDVSHLTGRSAFDYAPQAYQNSMAAYAVANGYSAPGLSDVDLNRLYFNSFPYQSTGGCFPAGTPVLLANGAEKAIETLQIGERVLASDGTKQVATTIMALIKPPPKMVYELLFDDGNTLTLTDSHPIMTDRGWKSLSPASTKRENPDLAVMALQIGDCIHTLTGTCTLLAIEPQEIVQVFNITVGEPHTFYASGILVHNKLALAAQIMQQVADTPVPQADLRNSILMQSLSSNFSDADLSHTFTATATWVGENLTNTFSGVASWIGQNLENAFTGTASWIGQGLSNTFSGVASWVGQNLENAFTGVASWIGQGLANTFTGIADWIGQNLEHTFTAVANWVTQEVTQVTSSIPGFASGVEGFAGGLAVVGENGPELVYLPQGTSVYPQSTGGYQPLNTGNESGPITITINHTTTLDGKVVAQESIPYIAPILRSVRGIRQ